MGSSTQKKISIALTIAGLLALVIVFLVARTSSPGDQPAAAIPATLPAAPAIAGVASTQVVAPAQVVDVEHSAVTPEIAPPPPDKVPVVAPAPAASQGPTVVYTHALATAPGEEWSATAIAEVPSDKRKYLGQFRTEEVTLSLASLPAHKQLKISFDLLVMRSWDGSNKNYHETFWDLNVAGGQNLIHTTFGNCGFFSDNNEQAFPDTWPCGTNPAWTGSVEHQTLGVFQSWGGPDRTFDCSSVYRLSLTFPHSDSKVAFHFKGTPTGSTDKPWGMAHMEVVAFPEIAPVGEEKLAAMWTALGSVDPMEAYKAHWDLVTAGDAAVGYIAGHLNDPVAVPVEKPATPDEIEALSKDLYSEDATKVEAAVAALTTKGPAALPVLEHVYEDPALSANNKTSVRNLVVRLETASRITVKESLADLQQHRARHLLQVIHSDEAMALAAGIKPHPGDNGLYQSPTIAPPARGRGARGGAAQRPPVAPPPSGVP